MDARSKEHSMSDTDKQSQFIPAKRKPAKPRKLKSVESKSAIPKDLEDKWGAVQAVATAHNLLHKGLYTHDYATAVKASLGFLLELHKQTVEDALKHPLAHLIPELKLELDKKEAANGQSKN